MYALDGRDRSFQNHICLSAHICFSPLRTLRSHDLCDAPEPSAAMKVTKLALMCLFGPQSPAIFVTVSVRRKVIFVAVLFSRTSFDRYRRKQIALHDGDRLYQKRSLRGQRTRRKEVLRHYGIERFGDGELGNSAKPKQAPSRAQVSWLVTCTLLPSLC